jgi:hypothetical protein
LAQNLLKLTLVKKQEKIALAIIGAFAALFLAFAIPLIIRAHNVSGSNPCINNLRQIDGAKQQWALNNGKSTNDTPRWEDIVPYLNLGRGREGTIPKCPHGGTYTIGKVGEDPKCTYPEHKL